MTSAVSRAQLPRSLALLRTGPVRRVSSKVPNRVPISTMGLSLTFAVTAQCRCLGLGWGRRCLIPAPLNLTAKPVSNHVAGTAAHPDAPDPRGSGP